MVIGKEEHYENDELKIYRGEDFIVQKHIILHQPTLGEICDFQKKIIIQCCITLQLRHNL